MGLPRLLFLENDYLRALTEAEPYWVETVLEELVAGRLTWDRAWLAEVSRRLSDEGPGPRARHLP